MCDEDEQQKKNLFMPYRYDVMNVCCFCFTGSQSRLSTQSA